MIDILDNQTSMDPLIKGPAVTWGYRLGTKVAFILYSDPIFRLNTFFPSTYTDRNTSQQGRTSSFVSKFDYIITATGNQIASAILISLFGRCNRERLNVYWTTDGYFVFRG